MSREKFIGHVTVREAARLAGCESDPELVAVLLPWFGARLVWRGKCRYVAEIDIPDLTAWVQIYRGRLRRPKKGRKR